MIMKSKGNYHIHINNAVLLLYYELQRTYFTFGMFIRHLATAEYLFEGLQNDYTMQSEKENESGVTREE